MTEFLLNRLSDLADTALVPALWLYEVVNVVEMAVRRKRIPKTQAFDFLESLSELPIEVDDLSRTEMFVSVWALAERYKLTAYDAAYLELAIRHRLPLASLDKDLNQAARAAELRWYANRKRHTPIALPLVLPARRGVLREGTA